jgi:hypothetical protein
LPVFGLSKHWCVARANDITSNGDNRGDLHVVEERTAPAARLPRLIGPNPQDFINLKSVDVVRIRAAYKFW